MRIAVQGDVDPCQAQSVLRALGEHLGFEVELRKARPPNPLYPELAELARRARGDWDAWGERLAAALAEAVRTRRLPVGSPEWLAVVRGLQHDHRAAIVARLTGVVEDQQAFERAVAGGLVTPGVRGLGYVGLAHRLGTMVDPTAAPAAPTSADFQRLLQEAVRLRLTPTEEAAGDYARRRAAIYMRRPVDAALAETDRVLTDDEYARLRPVIARAAEQGAGPRDTARRLREAVVGHPTLTNDLDRVARTELAFAHAHGAAARLEAQARAAGIADPLVFKFTRLGCCRECRRIWGPPGAPIPYRLSVIQARDAAGGNFRLPTKDWGPVTGPVHPNCTEGPLLLWSEGLVASVTRGLPRIRATAS